MGNLTKNDKMLLGFLSSLASSRMDALCKIVNASANVSSLDELRGEIENIFQFCEQAGYKLEESFTNSLEPDKLG